ncbi:MAG: response regulator transcription factor [Clostridia bacterium]
MATRVLVVEDDANIAELIRLYLEKDGYEVAIAADGLVGVSKFSEFLPNIILLDIMLPELDGFGVCREIRKTSDTPIIMLTAKDETFDKVMGLEIGADDYISKPFEMKEVIARIHAVLRRYSQKSATPAEKVLSFDNLVIDLYAYKVIISGERF